MMRLWGWWRRKAEPQTEPVTAQAVRWMESRGRKVAATVNPQFAIVTISIAQPGEHSATFRRWTYEDAIISALWYATAHAKRSGA